jgi:hypothetical protein
LFYNIVPINLIRRKQLKAISQTKGERKMKKAAFAIAIIGVLLISIFLFLQHTPPPAQATEAVVYSEGFETTDGSYTYTGTPDQWEWGTPAYASGPSSAHSGLKCWATNLDGDVSSGSDSYLISPQITLPSIGSDQLLRVQFYAWIAVDEMYDRGEFQVSSDGTAYVTVAELFHTMQGQWSAYDFDISNYAGGPIYLRFRLYADTSNAFDQSTFNMAGLYIDDVKITLYDAPAAKTTLTLEAYEDQGAYASCPWVFSWTGSEFVQDNDIYSTARGAIKEYSDYYQLSALPVPVNGKYLLDLREVTQETSYTDLVKLLAVDHSSTTKVAPDEDGNIWTYANPVAPASAIDGEGNDVLVQVANEDDAGFKAYDGDVITLDFNNIDVSSGATLVLRVAGFQDDGDPGTPTGNRPYVFVQTQDASQNWINRHYFYPRDDWATAAFDLTPYLTSNKLVRLYVTSCHTGKYQLIDFVGLDNSDQADKVVHILSPVSAVHNINGDVLPEIANSDNEYATMTSGEKISLSFEVPEMQNEVRDFVLLTKGYYIPSGTFFIYTWDGSSWVERDGWSIEGADDQTHDFDMSLFLPDPDGEFKVRIWQDYWYEPAGIDFVGLSHGGTVGTMESAFDLRKNIDVTSALEASDNIKDDWSTYGDIHITGTETAGLK